MAVFITFRCTKGHKVKVPAANREAERLNGVSCALANTRGYPTPANCHKPLLVHAASDR